jgi:hypothetical protein
VRGVIPYGEDSIERHPEADSMNLYCVGLRNLSS